VRPASLEQGSADRAGGMAGRWYSPGATALLLRVAGLPFTLTAAETSAGVCGADVSPVASLPATPDIDA
jgi:hypothetical protein